MNRRRLYFAAFRDPHLRIDAEIVTQRMFNVIRRCENVYTCHVRMYLSDKKTGQVDAIDSPAGCKLTE